MARAPQPDEQRLLGDHLRELRGRLLWWILSLVVFSSIALFFQRSLSAAVIAPLNSKLYYTSPLGGLDFIFKIILVFGLIPSLPVLLYQILRFIEPALPKKLGLILPRIIYASIALTIGSIVFSYSPLGLPLIFKFLKVFDSPQIQPLINAQEYFSFIMWYLLLIDIFIQLPLILVIYNFISPINLRKFNKYHFYILIVIFLLANAITPGIDPRPTLALFVPMVLVFEGCLLSIYRTNKKRTVSSLNVAIIEKTADELYKAGHYEKAFNQYQELINLSPDNAKAYAGLGRVCLQQHKFKQAADLFRQAIKNNSTSPSHYANLAIALISLELPSEALETLEQALELAPENKKYLQLQVLATEMKQKSTHFWK